MADSEAGEWRIESDDRVIEDLEWFGRKEARMIAEELKAFLRHQPTAETKNLKALRSNRFAQRELRLRGKYRVLFNVDVPARLVTVLAVGEKRGSSLFVRGEEFTEHHESNPSEQG